MQIRVVRFAMATLALLGCSSSGNPRSTTPLPGDGSACDGTTCASQMAGDGSTAGEGGDDSSPGTRTDLCSSDGPVTGPLPNGTAIVVDLGQSSDIIGQLLANDSVLLWRDSSEIRRVSLSGGSTTTVINRSSDTTDYSVASFAIDSQNVYFSDSALAGFKSYGLAKFPLVGAGTPITVVNDPTVGVMAVSDGYIYFQGELGGIERVPTTGGTPTLILDVQGGLRGLAVGGGYVYFMGTIGIQSFSNLYVARVSITAQAPEAGTGPANDAGADGGPANDASGADAGVNPAGSELVAITGLDTAPPVTDAMNVYWGDEDMLMMAPLAGGPPVMLAQADPITGLFTMTAVIEGIASDGTSVYWSSLGCQALRKSPVAGGAATTLVSGVSATSIALNSTHVYFTPTFTQVMSGPL